MTKLLLEVDKITNLKTTIVRSLTLTTLSAIDGMRRGAIIQFLYTIRWINGKEPLIDLRDADLSHIYLPRINLENMIFTAQK